MSDPKPVGFHQWAIVEVMGRQSYAGLVSEETIAGHQFVRIDVPPVDGVPDSAVTKLFGPSSIYSITPVSESVARLRAARSCEAPMSVWDLPPQIREGLRRLTAPTVSDENESDMEDFPC